MYHYQHLGMAAVSATPSLLHLVVGDLDVRLTPEWYEPLHLDRSVPLIHAEEVRNAVGSARDGPSVMILDTGVSASHPDFQVGNLAANVRASIENGLVEAVQQNIPIVDPSGHGTHVAGIVAGAAQGLGSYDPDRGKYEGVYSNGRIIGFQAAVQVTGELGEEETVVSGQGILAAFDWALAHQEEYDIRVVSNSWGSPGDLDPDDPVERATLELYLAGIMTVFSAGNEGEADTLNRHCTAPWSLCVAAGDMDRDRAPYSSYGNRQDPYAHPDLTGPGSSIRSADPVENPNLALQPLYRDRSGTSMAAPHVSGVAALLMAQDPSLSPDQVMDILVASAYPMSGPVHKVGGGFVDAARASILAETVEGNREQFLAGEQVKYAGARSGDPDHENDPVTAGITAPAGLLLPPPDEGLDRPVWIVRLAAGAGLFFFLVIAIGVAARR